MTNDKIRKFHKNKTEITISVPQENIFIYIVCRILMKCLKGQHLKNLMVHV